MAVDVMSGMKDIDKVRQAKVNAEAHSNGYLSGEDEQIIMRLYALATERRNRK